MGSPMKKSVLLLTSLILTNPPQSWSHGGHDHDAPVMVAAPKGGVIKSLEKTNVEVVSKGNTVSVYVYDKEMKPKNTTGFVVSAKAEMPRTKKLEDIPLVAKEKGFEGNFDAKGSHRYTFKLEIKDPATGHLDKMNFTIEPKVDPKK